ncbi:TssN family type VI secretion system protein [Flavobacterium jejuense]|uniref:TssN family type VI secretion system protein n=1 Tax=Flavobacterium jejuense TaxID=1544455 RepID=A0ABX0J101_9FLAO|nr:TssN family type VI secretion system protein [Flavobacterium jejuense]NHN27615.1 TssN family type VI secretion system protein [Flavobacterium jejuense]
MKKYLNYINFGQEIIYLLLLIAIALIINILIGSKIPKFRQQRKKFYLYIVIQVVIFIIFSCILYNLKDTSLNQRLISFQIYFAVAGIIHLKIFHDYFKKFEVKNFISEIAIIFSSSLFLAAFMYVITKYFSDGEFSFYLLSSLFFFISPSLCYKLFEYSISIPVKLHKRWFYPLNDKYPSPKVSEMKNIIILNLVFQKKATDTQIINFKVKAPRAIDFGRLFYYFINDYNEKNPNSQIHFVDEKNQPYGWYFYSKPKWFSSSEYIDPELAIDTNNIKDGSTIICQRI